MPGTRKLGRATDSRMAMLRAMVTFLLENGKIETTVARAKEVRSMAEKMITIAKEDTLHNRRLVLAFITKEAVTHKLFTEIAPQYKDRNGGYTRITKIGPRRGDAAEMAIIELIPVEQPAAATAPAASAAPKADEPKASEKPADEAEKTEKTESGKE